MNNIDKKYLETLKDVFNSLCQIPEDSIDLGDGRVLYVDKWYPKGEPDILAVGRLPVVLHGIIMLNKEEEIPEDEDYEYDEEQAISDYDGFWTENPDVPNPTDINTFRKFEFAMRIGWRRLRNMQKARKRGASFTRLNLEK